MSKNSVESAWKINHKVELLTLANVSVQCLLHTKNVWRSGLKKK